MVLHPTGRAVAKADHPISLFLLLLCHLLTWWPRKWAESHYSCIYPIMCYRMREPNVSVQIQPGYIDRFTNLIQWKQFSPILNTQKCLIIPYPIFPPFSPAFPPSSLSDSLSVLLPSVRALPRGRLRCCPKTSRNGCGWLYSAQGKDKEESSVVFFSHYLLASIS